MIRFGFIYFIFTIAHLEVKAIAIDNGVEGEPIISCGANEVSFSVATRKPFEGKIFVKGEYGKLDCTTIGSAAGKTGPTSGPESTTGPTSSTNPIGTGSSASGSSTFSPVPTPSRFTGSGIDHCPPCPICPTQSEQSRILRQSTGMLLTPNSAQLIVRIGTCNMKRERSLNPSGVALSLTIVVSFHQQFITKVDKAYQVRCFYMETDKTVTSMIDVSMPQTTEILAQAPMPVCTYSIRRTSPDGPEIQYAKVGDTVYHRWQCNSTTPAMFGMLVHSCYVDDGKGQRVEVINRTGCALDTFVINDLNYESSLYAYVETHVFKFADRAILDFQCAINICVKSGDGCRGITPPLCGGRRAKRDTNHNTTYEDELLAKLDEYQNDWDLHAQRLTIVDLDDSIRSEDLALFEQIPESRPNFASLSSRQHHSKTKDDLEIDALSIKPTFCLSIAAFGVLVSSLTFIFTVSSAVLTTLYFLRHKHN